jgi:hypothetical protein
MVAKILKEEAVFFNQFPGKGYIGTPMALEE